MIQCVVKNHKNGPSHPQLRKPWEGVRSPIIVCPSETPSRGARGIAAAESCSPFRSSGAWKRKQVALVARWNNARQRPQVKIIFCSEVGMSPNENYSNTPRRQNSIALAWPRSSKNRASPLRGIRFSSAVCHAAPDSVMPSGKLFLMPPEY